MLKGFIEHHTRLLKKLAIMFAMVMTPYVSASATMRFKKRRAQDRSIADGAESFSSMRTSAQSKLSLAALKSCCAVYSQFSMPIESFSSMRTSAQSKLSLA